MKFAVTDEMQGYVINAYAEGQFTVNGQIYESSLIITPMDLPVIWEVSTIDKLTQDYIDILAINDVETIILGTGKQLTFPEDELLVSLYDKNIGFECMDTPAACLTYNILLSEGRKVLLAAIPI